MLLKSRWFSFTTNLLVDSAATACLTAIVLCGTSMLMRDEAGESSNFQAKFPPQLQLAEAYHPILDWWILRSTKCSRHSERSSSSFFRLVGMLILLLSIPRPQNVMNAHTRTTQKQDFLAPQYRLTQGTLLADPVTFVLLNPLFLVLRTLVFLQAP
jgi:hypothetical protein